MNSNNFRFVDANQTPAATATELLGSSFSYIETLPGY